MKGKKAVGKQEGQKIRDQKDEKYKLWMFTILEMLSL